MKLVKDDPHFMFFAGQANKTMMLLDVASDPVVRSIAQKISPACFAENLSPACFAENLRSKFSFII
jgi:hypothetical protein